MDQNIISEDVSNKTTNIVNVRAAEENQTSILEDYSTVLMKTLAVYNRDIPFDVSKILDDSTIDKFRSLDIPNPFSNESSQTKSTKSILETRSEWYPFKGESGYQGEATTIYLNILTMAMKHPSQAGAFLNTAAKIHDQIGCVKTLQLWKRLFPILIFCEEKNMFAVMVDIAEYLLNNPDFVKPYITGFVHARSYIGKQTSFDILQDCVTRLSSQIQTYQDETIKFSSQILNISADIENSMKILNLEISKKDTS